MGWLNSNNSGPEEDYQTSDTQSDRSASPNTNTSMSSNHSNTELVSKISTMEAAHINQLHEVTSQMAERELQYKEDSKNKDVLLQQSENRTTSLERRIRERDGQMSSMKEDKAGCMRQIADLKNQLYQLQFEVEETTSDKAELANEWQSRLNDSQRELLEAKRALDDALQSQVDAVTKATALEHETNALRKQHTANRGSQATELAALQGQLSELQGSNATLTAQIAEERENSANNKQLNSKEISGLRSMLRARDDAIQSLQGRVEKSQEDMTALEEELDGLREEKRGPEEGKVKESADRINNLTRENDEMNRLVQEQNQALKDMTSKFDRQDIEYKEQCLLVEKRGEEIELLKSALREGELEREVSAERSNSTHSRASSLEMELQTMNEKVDELTSALHESLEEIEDLQADLIFKEGRITSLEKEIEEASNVLKSRDAADDDEESNFSQPSGRKEPGNFARLRQEIKNVTRDRAQLESDHALQLSLLKTSHDRDIAKLEKDLEAVRSELQAATDSVAAMKASLEETETSKKDLEQELEKTREVMDQLDAEEDRELEETKQGARELQLALDKQGFEIEDLRMMLKDKEQELANKDVDVQGELREAQQALIVLDRERRSPTRSVDDDNGDYEKINSLGEQLSACNEQLRDTEAKLTRTIREKERTISQNEMAISDLKVELSSKDKYAEDLKDEFELLQLSVEKGASKRNYGMSIDPEWHEPDTISKLKLQVSTLGKKKDMVENELRAKIDVRDSTIATLVLSSSHQEASIADLKSEVNRLQMLVDNKSSSAHDASQQLKDLEGSRRREVNTLRDRAQDLTIELKQARRKLLLVTEELECAKSQLEAAGTMAETQDLAGRLVIAEQTQKMLKTENSDKLKERDAAIANLLQSVQANEGVISNLRVDVDSFKNKLNNSVQENRRLQHESEIFAQQIIDQDEEFESLNTKLREKTSEIAMLKRDIASSSADLRGMKNIQSQLDELRQEKRHNLSRISTLEVELRDVELKKAQEDGFEVDRLKLELKNAIADKEITEENLTHQIESLRKLRNHAVEDYEAKLRVRDGQISSLEKELLELRETQDDFDDIFLEDKPGQQSKKQLLDERDVLMTKIEALGEEIESLRAALAQEDSHETVLSELKSKLAQSEQLREDLDKERMQISTSKDREMDRLHRQITEAKEAQTTRELEQLSLLKKLESENSDIRQEFTIRIKEKNARIVALEQTLAAQEQVVGNMSSEMDQLQNGMEKISVQRRAELEEMQQELMDYTSKATRLEREVMTLSMKLTDKKIKHKGELAKLKDKIESMEADTSMERTVRHDRHDDRQRENELEEKNGHLKWLNSSLKDENGKLKDKVEKLKANCSKKKDESPSAKNNDKWRNVALQEQVAVLSQRVIELEEAASTVEAASQSRHAPQSPRPSILHSPIMRSSLEKGSPSSTPNSTSTPRSALRVSTYDTAAANNQANNDLLSNSEDEQQQRGGGLSARNSAGALPPSLPRPGSSVTPGSSSGKSKGSKMSSSRFSLRKKSSNKDRHTSSPKFDDASNSTTNYDF
eukprot:CAMPEP_0181126054 /NCGR_PEP_ID=MMETSP1071-20121207/27402_1 /TAXON_ID=35127 /ORGANISM="Thalassiosira sp., Strain NH16" /LENGTH=1547 /DNA_ID=CAMNT_0023211585 /DNA_START=115 /DNA_END=4758 /DNA_ORIENTATION=-